MTTLRVKSYVLNRLIFGLCLIVIVYGRFRCHNRCSGHGYCSDYDNICYCEDGYQGLDCSQKICPQDFAWADKAYAPDSAHQLAECSNAGRCNSKTGVCDCSPGFTGIACQLTKCGGGGVEGCNGHGECLTTAETYELVTTRKGVDVASQYLGVDLPWERTHTTMCSCHVGYAGASCEYRLCPKGDDQLTPSTGYRTITITLHTQQKWTKISGNFLFQFNGESFLFPGGATAFDAIACKNAFENLHNIAEVDCSLSGIDDYRVTYTVKLKKFPVIPYETNIFTHNGNPSLSSFSCNTDLINKVNPTDHLTCSINEINTEKIYPEYTSCSSRGICDYNTGVCYCFQQFDGPNCGYYKLAIAEASVREVSTEEVLVISSTNPAFDKTILQFQTFDIGTDDFKTISVKNLDREVFALDGYGNINMYYGGLIIGDTGNSNLLSEYSGMTINTAGLTITGGLTAKTDTLVIDGRAWIQAGGITINNGGMSVVGTAEINGECAVSGGFSVSKGLSIAQGLNVAAGGGTIAYGGLALSGGLTVASSGLTVNKRGVTLYSGGLVVSGGIQLLKVRSSLTVHTLVEIESDGMTATGGITVNDQGIDTGGGMSIGSGGLVLEEMALNSGGVYVNGGLTVFLDGMVVAGGVTTNDLGVTLDSAVPSNVLGGATVMGTGLTIKDGLIIDTVGLVVSNGLTIPIGDVTVTNTASAVQVNAGVVITGGMTVGNTGMVATSGITVYDSGLMITANGLSIESGGIHIYNGASVTTEGLRVTGGVTLKDIGVVMNDLFRVSAAGLSVTDGMTVFNTGVTVTAGGVTIGNNGLTVTNGMTVRSGGVLVTGGVSVYNNGLRVTGGLSLHNTVGLHVTGGLSVIGTIPLSITGGLSVETMGLVIQASGLTVQNAGLTTALGLTVENQGLYVTGGLTIQNEGVVVALGGMSINSGSLKVTGGMTLFGSGLANSVANSMTVYAGAVVTTGCTISTTGLRVAGGITVSAGGFFVTGGATIDDGASLHSLSVFNSGITVEDGISINSGGLSVTNTGLTLHNAGLRVTGGLTLYNTQGLILTGGMSIRNAGVVVANGATLHSNGLGISSGLTIGAAGLTSTGTGNFVIDSDGLNTAAGLTVGADGLVVTGGLTVEDVGIEAYTLKVNQGGVKTGDTLTLNDQGLKVSHDSTVLSGGLVVNGGITVRGVSFDVLTPTVFVNQVSGGVPIFGAAPVLVQDDGAVVNGGLTVNGAVYISGSATTSDERLKTDFAMFSDPLALVASMRGVYYNWVDPVWDENSGRLTQSNNSSTGHNTTTTAVENNTTTSSSREPLRFVGLIAQEVQSVLPEAVREGDLGNGQSILGVRYTDLVALLVEAVKALDARTTTSSSSSSSMKTSTHLFETPTPIPTTWTSQHIQLLQKYFIFDKETGLVNAVNPAISVESCNSCGGDTILLQMLKILQRIQNLENEEIVLTRKLNDFLV